jgi:hypothetical protein
MTLTAVQFKSGFGFGQTNTFDGQIMRKFYFMKYNKYNGFDLYLKILIS